MMMMMMMIVVMMKLIDCGDDNDVIDGNGGDLSVADDVVAVDMTSNEKMKKWVVGVEIKEIVFLFFCRRCRHHIEMLDDNVPFIRVSNRN